ncbi:hypothetical protein TrST_g8841 [Triparma strigata]|uniref:Fe2OG dioxygenase domain-containing protein n=1 Tax=Triparma strigata TaxID=1606541 RepID=A0A9W7A9X3_9STRA|nr:hypothetical protein TrST_g8841 [Triparma strigata]
MLAMHATSFLRLLVNRVPKHAHSSMNLSTSSTLLPLLSTSLTSLSSEISESLHSKGYWHTPDSNPLLPLSEIKLLRSESLQLRAQNRFEQSYSESITSSGHATRFDKPGVYACEPDGADYDTAPNLLTYMSHLIREFPELLNEGPRSYGISNEAFNAKLAVTSSGGSGYPKHIDNPRGLAVGDTRKLTCILYLNPSYVPSHLGLLHLHLHTSTISISPSPGRFVCFWSDLIPHSVSKTSEEYVGEEYDRYAITVWMPTVDGRNIHDPESPFIDLKV